MKSTGHEREIEKSEAGKPGIAAALVTCTTFAVTAIGAAMVTAGPWLVLGYYL